jgi:mRNA-degrading endonuclease RelE of RelBE toxin-antitoxin system
VAAKKKAKPGRATAAKAKPPPRARSARAPKTAAPALPAPDGDAPLQELTRDELSVFLYAALLPEETLQIVRELGLSVPGFRTEALSEPERCDLIADEVRAAPALRARILDALRNGFGRPPLVGVGLDPRAAQDLVDVGVTEHGTVLALWRVLSDPAPDVRALARPLLARMLDEYYGPPPGKDGEEVPPREGGPEGGPEGAQDDAGRLRQLERQIERLRERAEQAQAKRDERTEKLQGQLKEARAAEARGAGEAARAREAAEAARRALARAEAALEAALGTDAAAEAHRARQDARELNGKVAAAEARAERAEGKVAELARALEDALARSSTAAPAQPSPADSDEPDEAPASWLLPIYTREFYDSLEGWERRIQRAAFKQAHLLAQDHRHPSLRALPLEGLPGYYRVRVATDVRLIYRRGEQQSAVEILSLIDREDLDRYVRQAKTRG